MLLVWLGSFLIMIAGTEVMLAFLIRLEDKVSLQAADALALALSGLNDVVLFIVICGLISEIVLRRHNLTWESIGLRAPPSPWLKRSFLLVLVFIPVKLVLTILEIGFVDSLLPEPDSTVDVQDFEMPEVSTLTRLLLLFGVVVLVPVCEELLFRGLIFKWMRVHLGFWSAACLSGLLFSLSHNDPDQIVSRTLSGVLYAYLVERTASIWPAVILHGATNLIAGSVRYLS